MINPVASTPVRSPLPSPERRLTVVLRAHSSRVELTRESVTAADLSDVFSEAWLNNTLRKGRPNVPFADAGLRLVPTLREGSTSSCAGFDVVSAHHDGTSHVSQFTLRFLEPVASRAADRLVQARVLQPHQKYLYEVLMDDSVEHAPVADEEAFAIHIQSQPLSYLRVPLRPLLDQARVEKLADDECFHAFYTESALSQAQRAARRGAGQNPPVETGAVLIGSLCACPESGEFFCVVHDVLDVRDAEQTEFSLHYTSKSWTRIQTLMRARQSARPGRAERLLGQTHGHNFLPNDGQTCEACPTRATCDLSNIFVSSDDRLWSRAVFFRQPWQLCHIFGLTARGDKVSGLFGLRDGRLCERGFFVLPEFDLDHWSHS